MIVSAPRSATFQRLVDEYAETQPLTCYLIRSMQTDGDQPIAAGTTGRATWQTGAFVSTTASFRVQVYSKNERFVVAWQSSSGSATDEYVFSDAGSGTMVQFITSFDLSGPRFRQRLHALFIARHSERDLRHIKWLFEGNIGAKPQAKTPWRALLIFCIIAAVIAVIWATYRSLNS
ncbi:MAG TPA: hypothetical protein VIT43_07375 [Candidatus Dormibacteraeota bacterium]